MEPAKAGEAPAARRLSDGKASRAFLVVDGGYYMSSVYDRQPRTVSPLGFLIEFVKELERKLELSFERKFWYQSKSENRRLAEFQEQVQLAPPNGPQFDLHLFDFRTRFISKHGRKATCACGQCTCDQVSVRVEKGVDVAIATKLIELAYRNQATNLVLLSGDGDFTSPLSLK